MHESAQIEAVLELLTECETSWGGSRPLPADILIHHFFKARRYMGSKDRGAIAELIYYIIRHRASLIWWAERSGEHGARAYVIAALLLHRHCSVPQLQELFGGDKFSPARLSPSELAFAKMLAGKSLAHPDMPDHARYNYPQWLESELRASLGNAWKKEIEALSNEATVDLRANTLLTTRDALLAALKKEGYDTEATKLSPIGVRLRSRMPVFTSDCFKRGWFEMQDEGSQIVSLMIDAKPGEKVIDFCAGAGGKTLALAAQMQNKGRILAWDTSEKRLAQMVPRLRRAKIDNVQRHALTSENDAFIKRHKDSADAVLIDAPCGGSGTWRRNPDLKWRFGESDLIEIRAMQKNILESAARLVKRGGRMLYVTCSLLQSENESQIETFLAAHSNFRVAEVEKMCSNFSPPTMIRDGSLHLTPHKDGTDGFFASLLQRCE